MFRLPNEFWKKVENRYTADLIETSSRKPDEFRMEELPNALKKFVDNKLEDLDPWLFAVYDSRHKNKGYGRDNLFKLRAGGKDFSRDLVDLLSWYGYDHNYEYCIKEALVPVKSNTVFTNDLDTFFRLKTHRAIREEAYSEGYYKKIFEALEKKFNGDPPTIRRLYIEDLETLKRMEPLNKIFTEGIRWDLVADRMQVNRDIAKGMEVKNQNEMIITGFFILYPINNECVECIKNESILGSDFISIDHICNTYASATAIYISIVFGVDEYLNKAFLLARMIYELSIYLHKYPKITTVFLRPTKPDGFRNAKAYKFMKLHETSEIYYQDSKVLLANEEDYAVFNGDKIERKN